MLKSRVLIATLALVITAALAQAAGAGAPTQVGTPVQPDCRGLAATVVGTVGDDVITGTAGNDVIVAFEGNDRVRAGAGNDVICGGAGFDTLAGGAGDDTLDGGADGDAADYTAAEDGVVVDLAMAGPQDTGQGSDTLISLTDVYGSALGDTLSGRDDNGAAIEFLMGGAGNDVISGRGGRDRLDGNWDDDQLDPGAGADQVNGQDGADTIEARDGAVDAVTCGEAVDALQADPADTVAADCEVPDGGAADPPSDGGADAGGGGQDGGGDAEDGSGQTEDGSAPEDEMTGSDESFAGDSADVPEGETAEPPSGSGASRITVPAQSLPSVLSRGLIIKHRCASVCRATWTVTVSRQKARRLGISAGRRGPIVIARASSIADAGVPGVALAKISGPARRALRRARGVTVVVTGALESQDGAATETALAVRLRR